MPIRQRNDRKNPLHVTLTHAIMEETWRISPEMRAFLMKKLFSLLLVLALALVPTLSLADDDAAFAKASDTLNLTSQQINWAHLQALSWAEAFTD